MRIFRIGMALLALLVVVAWTQPVLAGPLPGAVFTTNADGTLVDGNIYQNNNDVHLDGGPGPHAPQGAASLPDGDYYFQVTDPSGKNLLSKDAVMDRKFTVLNGIIVSAFNHLTGIDVDHGALTVQLMPFKNTPNNGGVYKVWATPVSQFVGDPTKVDNPNYYHGFVPAWSKTDCYKVKGKPCVIPIILVRKFHDVNANGAWDLGEPEIGVNELLNGGGWPITVTDPLGIVTTGFTPATVETPLAGTYHAAEDNVAGWAATTPPGVDVVVAGTCGESHEVTFGNIKLAKIVVSKNFDLKGDGIADNIPIAGIRFVLTGTAINGSTIGPIQRVTGADGKATFAGLLPGTYTVTEILPYGFSASNGSPTSVLVNLAEGATETVSFLDFCYGPPVSTFTKGYWQNQGCGIVTVDDLAYLNSLAPFASGTIQTNGQDNCTGSACPSSINLPFDSVSELGCFLTAPNSQDGRMQLTQQLAAFILNVRHGMTNLNGALVLSDGNKTAQEIINGAVNAWVTGTDVAAWSSYLDSLNSDHTFMVISATPCAINY